MAHAGGRPTKYDAKYHVPWARGLAMRGTAERIAEQALEGASYTDTGEVVKHGWTR